jgi:prepilin-type processing-associated H-X9-DG protein/prepilin-type N-terminal cleavage/methylation domain-containing protein
VRRRGGFTFIEMFTAMAIVGVLMAILFPVFAKAREKARQTNCLSNLQNIGVGLKIYAQDYSGHFPPGDNDLWPLIPNQLPEADVFVCPSVVIDRPLGYPPPYPADRAATGQVLDYVYRGGLCDDDLPSQFIAGEDWEDMHNGGANYLWLDGHCKWMTRAEKLLSSSGQTADLASLGELQKLRQAKNGATAREPLPAPPFYGGGKAAERAASE